MGNIDFKHLLEVYMDNDEIFQKTLKDNGFEFRDTNFGTALFYNGMPVPHTVNKSKEYLTGFMIGFTIADKRRKDKNI